MKLFYKPGACSLAPHIVLREIGAPFDLDKVDTAAMRTESGANYMDVNPTGYVPAVKLDNGAILMENPALLQYLADQAPESALAPAAGSFERVRLQEVLNFIATELHKSFSPFFSGLNLSDAEKDRAFTKLRGRLDAVERMLDDGREFLTGAAYTVADAYAFVILNWTSGVGLPLDGWPKTKAFFDRIGARPAVRDAMVAEGLIAA